MKIIKWASIPVLLAASLFSSSAASYELLVNALICMGAIILLQRAVWSKEYFWAGGVAAIVVGFSPLSILMKVFVLMGLACMATFANLIAAFRTQTVPAG